MFPDEDMASRTHARLDALDRRPDYCVLLKIRLMNSNKCVTVIPPA